LLLLKPTCCRLRLHKINKIPIFFPDANKNVGTNLTTPFFLAIIPTELLATKLLASLRGLEKEEEQ
jgi:hypothetical protein